MIYSVITMQDDDTTVRYVVKDEHTLGYIRGNSQFMEVLAGSVIRGGHDPKNGSVCYRQSSVRPATQGDFDIYRVRVPPGVFSTRVG